MTLETRGEAQPSSPGPAARRPGRATNCSRQLGPTRLLYTLVMYCSGGSSLISFSISVVTAGAPPSVYSVRAPGRRCSTPPLPPVWRPARGGGGAPRQAGSTPPLPPQDGSPQRRLHPGCCSSTLGHAWTRPPLPHLQTDHGIHQICYLCSLPPAGASSPPRALGGGSRAKVSPQRILVFIRTVILVTPAPPRRCPQPRRPRRRRPCPTLTVVAAP